MASLDGVNGQIQMHDDHLVITRNGFGAKLMHGFTKGEKTIYFEDITSIQLKEGGLANGYIQFTIPGGNERLKGLLNAKNDENSVIFKKSENEKALKIKNFIERKKKATRKPQQSFSVADEISKLKLLMDSGIITQEQFEEQKSKLLK